LRLCEDAVKGSAPVGSGRQVRLQRRLRLRVRTSERLSPTPSRWSSRWRSLRLCVHAAERASPPCFRRHTSALRWLGVRPVERPAPSQRSVCVLLVGCWLHVIIVIGNTGVDNLTSRPIAADVDVTSLHVAPVDGIEVTVVQAVSFATFIVAAFFVHFNPFVYAKRGCLRGCRRHRRQDNCCSRPRGVPHCNHRDHRQQEERKQVVPRFTFLCRNISVRGICYCSRRLRCRNC